MMYKAKVAVCSEIRTKHSTQSEHHVEFLNENLLAMDFFFSNFSTFCFWNVSNTETKQGSIMK